MLFLAVTAEEQGLLGSEHYAVRPLYPLAKTLAGINMDGLNPYGRTSDVDNRRLRQLGPRRRWRARRPPPRAGS